MTNIPEILRVDLPGSAAARSYDILIGGGVLAQAGEFVKERLGPRACLIVSDRNVAARWLAPLQASLAQAGHRLKEAFLIEPGEASKEFAWLQNLLSHMLAQNIDRRSLIVALGGGVVGDLAGFAAAIALRGVDFVQVPTSLLAQVDSAVGGKTAIDMSQGKNLVGAFHQPRLVLADTEALRTLSDRELCAGYAEIVKYGLIGDKDFFVWCETHGQAVLQRDPAALAYAVRASCAHKARIVAADERESGVRALLNLGHTFGHALETLTGYDGTLLHGEAVAIGTALAFRLSAKLGLCSGDDAESVVRHLAAHGLPTAPPYAADPACLTRLMTQDKKAEDGKINLILARGIGRAFMAHDIKREVVEDIWRSSLTKN